MRIIDSHTHIGNHRPEDLVAVQDRYKTDRFNVLSIPCYYGPLNTLECLITKRLAPGRAYVYGGMVYTNGIEPNAKDHEKQLELMLAAGCDGWKILESKPSVYRELQLPLDSDVFDSAFALAERESLPIIWHAGDPATFWDAERAPEFAARNGWLCIGEGFPTLEKIYSEVENVLARHPKLHVSMAHLYFTSDDRLHAERLLDTYDNFWLDLTPGTEMYGEFLNDHSVWKPFFEKYLDRLVFGTDYEDECGPAADKKHDGTRELIFGSFAGTEPVNAKGMNGVGLGLAPSVQEKIFAANFERRNGATPRPLNESGLTAYVEWLMPRLSTEDRLRAEKLLNG